MSPTLLSPFILIIHTTNAALTNCISPTDNCLCVWDLPVSNIRHANGQYRLLSQSSEPTSKKWIMDDVESPQSAQPCHSTAKMFWYASACAGRWFLGDDTYDGQCTGNCFCNSNGISDPLSASCPTGKYDCFWQVSISNITHVYDQLTVTFGRCPQITNTCDRIKVTASSPRDVCNGIYNKIDYSPTGLTLDNEINIYVNSNQTVRNRFVYYDHHIQKWVCSETYKPCDSNFGGKIVYIGKANDPGTPDPFKSESGITVGSTWTVQEWSNDQNDPQSVPVTFECYAPDIPTTDNPTSTPTTVITTQPTDSPTPPIQTDNPTTDSPTPTPTTNPLSTQTDIPTLTTTTITNQPSDNPTTTPTYTSTDSTTHNPITLEPSTTTYGLLTTSTVDAHTTNIVTSSTLEANQTHSTTKIVTDIPTTLETNVSTQSPIETSVIGTELDGSDELNVTDGLFGIDGLKIEYVAIFIVTLVFCLATICCCCGIIFWFKSDKEYDNKNDYNQTNKMIKYETTNQEDKDAIVTADIDDNFEYYV